MYAAGIPMGMITDRKSPRLAAIIGMFCLLVGYYPIKIGETSKSGMSKHTDCEQRMIVGRVE
jgi:hypothetical protein